MQVPSPQIDGGDMYIIDTEFLEDTVTSNLMQNILTEFSIAAMYLHTYIEVYEYNTKLLLRSCTCSIILYFLVYIPIKVYINLCGHLIEKRRTVGHSLLYIHTYTLWQNKILCQTIYVHTRRSFSVVSQFTDVLPAIFIMT